MSYSTGMDLNSCIMHYTTTNKSQSILTSY